MTEEKIHPQAIVSPEAKIASGVEIGAFAVVEAGVELGEGCVVHSHAVIVRAFKIRREAICFIRSASLRAIPRITPTAETALELVAGKRKYFSRARDHQPGNHQGRRSYTDRE